MLVLNLWVFVVLLGVLLLLLLLHLLKWLLVLMLLFSLLGAFLSYFLLFLFLILLVSIEVCILVDEKSILSSKGLLILMFLSLLLSLFSVDASVTPAFTTVGCFTEAEFTQGVCSDFPLGVECLSHGRYGSTLSLLFAFGMG